MLTRPQVNVTAEFTRDLATHLRSCGFYAACEVPLVTKGAFSSQSRADVYAIKLHEFAKKDTRIYEVKTARADFLRDLDAGKSEGYRDFARRVYFACPSGLIKKHEVPVGMGLLTRSKAGGWSVQVAPQPGELVEPSTDLMLLLLQRGEREIATARSLRERVNWEANVALRDRAKNLGWEVRSKLAGHRAGYDPRREAADSLLVAVERALGGVPEVGEAPPGKRLRQEIRRSHFRDNIDRYVKIALELLDEAERLAKVASYMQRFKDFEYKRDDAKAVDRLVA